MKLGLGLRKFTLPVLQGSCSARALALTLLSGVVAQPITLLATPTLAQDLAPARPADTRILEQRIQQNERVLEDALPPIPPKVGPLESLDSGEYILEFNRSPIVGSRLQLRSIYDEARVRFTRPRNWNTETRSEERRVGKEC